MAAAASSSAASAVRSARWSSCSDCRFSTRCADFVQRPLHRRLGLVPPGAAGFGRLTDGGIELAGLGLERFVDLVTALLELRSIRLERGGGRASSTLTRAASSSRDSDSGFMGFSVLTFVLTRRT